MQTRRFGTLFFISVRELFRKTNFRESINEDTEISTRVEDTFFVVQVMLEIRSEDPARQEKS